MERRILNLPNALTTSRIIILPLMAYFVEINQGMAACAVLIVGSLTDFFDGYFARQYKQETAFGKLMDPVADKLLLCVATLYLMGKMPEYLSPLLATLLLAREFLISGLRALAASEGLVIEARQAGKIKAVAQFVGLGALMVGMDSDFLWFATFGLYALWFSVLLSYFSMVEYLWRAYLALKEKLR